MAHTRNWQDLFTVTKPVIGMLHLPALPGSPASKLSLNEIEAHCLKDADALIKGGCHGLMLENFGDSPFYPEATPKYVTSTMTRIALKVKQRFGFPLGINVLRNDAHSALAIALAAEADFIRVNILCGTRVTDQGIISGSAYSLLRERKQLNADHIAILADVDVKHSAPLAFRKTSEEAQELIERSGASAIIVSGSGTGAPVDLKSIEAARSGCRKNPLLIGSGVTAKNIADYVNYVDGFIVGSSFKPRGNISSNIDRKRVRALTDALHKAIEN